MAEEKKKIIQFKNIVKSFEDGQVVLKGVSLDIYENEFVTLLGPSGCGKTTLLRILGGFLLPSEGKVLFDGEDIVSVRPTSARSTPSSRSMPSSPTWTCMTTSPSA